MVNKLVNNLINKKEFSNITGLFLRWFAPSVILLPLICAALIWLGLKENLFSVDLSIILLGMLIPSILLLFVAITALLIYQAEKRLKRSESIARLLVENRKDYAIFMLDAQGIITSWNAGAERLTGYMSDEVIGEHFAFLFKPEDRQNNKPERILERARIEKQIEYDGWQCHKQGTWIWMINTLTAIYNDNHELIGFTQLMRNASRQKEADDKLKHSLDSLEQSNKELERFAYIASHDLQEPLRMVASFTQLLEKKYKNKLDGEAMEYINFAVDGALRMQQLITDLLTYSRVSITGKMFTPTNCNSILKEAIFNLNVAINESHAEITHEVLPTIMADDTQILQVFQNILSNAIKFRKPNTIPKIHISTELKNNEWYFSFSDNGIGISPEYQEQVFLIFQRLHTKQEYSGTGIGLAICKKIIDRHGGKIWIESTLGQGAKFCFTIPT